MNIIPAILPKSQSELEEKASLFLGKVPMIQVDICDGIFVPNKTEFSDLPFQDQVSYEFDLMIDRPEESLQDYLAMNPKSIVFHVESIGDQGKLLEGLKDFGGEIGISISNETPVEVLQSWIPAFAGITQSVFIQLMGIAKIGFQGEPFDDRVLERIKFIRENYPGLEIAIDGGVNLDTIKKLQDAGVTRFVSGSAAIDLLNTFA